MNNTGRIYSHTERIHIDPGSYLNEDDGLWYPCVTVRCPAAMNNHSDKYTSNDGIGYASSEAAKPAALAMAAHISSVIRETVKDGVAL